MNKELPERRSEHNPNFVFGGNRIISEENWTEYEVKGVRNLVAAIPDDDEVALREELSADARLYLPENLLLGDAFDAEAGRPLRLKSGIGVYVTTAGQEYYRRHFGRPSATPANLPRLRLPDGTHTVPRPGTQIRIPHQPHHDADGAVE
jgi:hypothetical protein